MNLSQGNKRRDGTGQYTLQSAYGTDARWFLSLRRNARNMVRNRQQPTENLAGVTALVAQSLCFGISLEEWEGSAEKD
jgi:hypothetical protein